MNSSSFRRRRYDNTALMGAADRPTLHPARVYVPGVEAGENFDPHIRSRHDRTGRRGMD